MVDVPFVLRLYLGFMLAWKTARGTDFLGGYEDTVPESCTRFHEVAIAELYGQCHCMVVRSSGMHLYFLRTRRWLLFPSCIRSLRRRVYRLVDKGALSRFYPHPIELSNIMYVIK